MRLVRRVFDRAVVADAKRTFRATRKVWSQVIPVAAPIYESHQLISFGGRAFLVAGGIGPHFVGLLVPKGKPLNLGDLFLICAQASFFVDGAVVPQLNYGRHRDSLRELVSLNALFKKSSHQGVDAYFDALATTAATCDDLFAHASNGGQRVVGVPQPDKWWLHCELPATDDVKRALLCYWR